MVSQFSLAEIDEVFAAVVSLKAILATKDDIADIRKLEKTMVDEFKYLTNHGNTVDKRLNALERIGGGTNDEN